MNVILIQDVDKLGKRGDVVTVSDGYARNYLLPRKMAKRATPSNIEAYKREAHLEEKRAQKQIERAKIIRDGLRDVVLNFKMKAGDDGKLFGSITTKDISEELANLGHKIDKHRIKLYEPIRNTGSYNVEVELAGDIRVTLPVIVVKE
ncbi:MAG: 50S ribosomal protein L9 [Candidatus Coatesbacteria bacterium 4484_99]|uniref:Large ribosomal subunit protein bL9 n=1 Tax=Candidatus Coatesbacteria bacterium 4484_99 TaxID=1970774 RepID=A0A1W9S1Y5_9BACT|nr:MAG: 50S ribosomal protein L9 [Candidatus Coatesbacteria bacterium 4484_99]RLC40681.1 MAG: 50S ribosomal protein L9 [Candidatus Coatesbacteria bacterium]RLC41241.1 MAG: 50S ribosomal protein L9 [Candidatus Coatesbacteria bacterium]RLC42664.1 MAG: 50S ribosomal protein L9 [Candidatus Coatesbacteria bacterium]